jgi:hypothetical protein
MQTTQQDQLNKIESRLKNIESAVWRLTEMLARKKTNEPDVFEQMVNSPAFQKELEETIALYKKDPSQFSNPFDALRKHRANV